MDENRPTTIIDRKVEVKGETIEIVSEVKETMSLDSFFEQNKQKIQTLTNNQQQLVAITHQMRLIEDGLPKLDDEQTKELMELKDKFNMIRNTDKLRSLKQNAQRLEVDIGILQKDIATFQEVEKRQNPENRVGMGMATHGDEEEVKD